MSRLLKLIWLLLVPLVAADETSIDLVFSKIEADLQVSERPSRLPVLLLGIEDDLLDLPEQAKLQVIIRSLELSVDMLGLRDHAVPIDGSVKRWPDFDWKKYGQPPLFGGASPDAISDPTTREAYVRALEANDLLLSKVDTEKSLLQDVDYFLSLTQRVIKSSDNQGGILEAVDKYLTTSEVPQSAAKYIRERLFDPEPVKTPPTIRPSSGKKPAATDPHSATVQPTTAPFAQPPAQSEKLEVTSTPTPSQEPTLSTPWGMIVVSIVAAIGLLWLLMKKRK